MYFLSCLFSLILSFIALPACCVVEYYAGLKMGMYRFVVLYNTKITKILTPDLMPYISWTVIIIIFAALVLSFMRCVKILWRLYGLILLALSVYIFMSALKAAPWFAVIIILSGAFWVLSILTRK